MNETLKKLHLDPMLIGFLMLVLVAGVFILYSAGGQSLAVMSRQLLRYALAFAVLFIFAQIPPRRYYQWVPIVFVLGLGMLVAVDVIGHITKGAQRWLTVGFIRFQPSELMKLAVPMMIAWYLHERPLPPSFKSVLICTLIFAIPMALVAKQPDLGTAIIIGAAGAFALLLSGLSIQFIAAISTLIAVCMPVLWHFMHGYQRDRVLTFLNPERDPLGAGYHIIQSKIAIGSGGVFGKGWLNGTQSHLQFLPEHATDFIFAVTGEEFGFLGSVLLIFLLLGLVARGLYISLQAQDTFSRLLAGSISLILFISFFVNIGMVTGILPVVGLPLPLISYGGTSMVTIMAGLGIIMSIHTHRQLVGR